MEMNFHSRASLPGGGSASAKALCAGLQQAARQLACVSVACAGPGTWFNVSEDGRPFTIKGVGVEIWLALAQQRGYVELQPQEWEL